MAQSWTPERRQAMRDRINQTKPWLKSTGPKTPEGKAKVSQNACKPDSATQRMAQLNLRVRALLKNQREALARIQ